MPYEEDMTMATAAAAQEAVMACAPIANTWGCINCGNCMIGCSRNAKNTLTVNDLYLAEKRGAGPAVGDGAAILGTPYQVAVVNRQGSDMRSGR
jgi:hypothetical protein